MEVNMNALYNCSNPYQGKAERVLVVCSAGLLRSPTIAGELYKRGYNSRSCGMYDYALIQYNTLLETWADTIIFLSESLRKDANIDGTFAGKILVMDIPDKYEYRHPELVEEINKFLDVHFPQLPIQSAEEYRKSVHGE